MDADKIRWINYAKAGGIILVVIGHVVLGFQDKVIEFDKSIYGKIYKIIASFHMPLFFFISGYLYTYMKYDLKQYINFEKKKLSNLFIPYIVFNFLYAALGFIIHDNKYSAINLPFILISPVSHFWFIYVMGMIFLIYPLIRRITRFNNACIVLSLIVISCCIKKYTIGTIYLVAIYMMYFSLGNLIKEKSFTLIVKNKIIIIIGILYFFSFMEAEKNPNSSIHDLINIVTAVLGIIFFLNVMNRLCEFSDSVSNVMDFVGSETMPIYLCHSLFVSASRKILFYLQINNLIFFLIVGIIAGMCGPLFLRKILGFTPYLEWMIYPNKAIEKGKNEKY